MKPELRRFQNVSAMGFAAAELFIGSAKAAVKERGHFNVGLSGGRGPLALFSRLRELGREALPWAQTTLYWVDERWVPYDSVESNFGTAKRMLLDPLGLLNAVQPIAVDLGSPEIAAKDYEVRLRDSFRGAALFDLCLLGMGEDGHTASLFPGSTALLEQTRYCVAVTHPVTGQARMTLTLPALNACREQILLIDVQGKERVLKLLMDQDPVAQDLPVARLTGALWGPLWLVTESPKIL